MNAMEFIVAQATIAPMKSVEPWNKKMSADLAAKHNRMIAKLTDKWGFVTTKMLKDAESISENGAYTIIRHAASRGFIKHDGTRANLKRYVRTK